MKIQNISSYKNYALNCKPIQENGLFYYALRGKNYDSVSFGSKTKLTKRELLEKFKSNAREEEFPSPDYYAFSNIWSEDKKLYNAFLKEKGKVSPDEYYEIKKTCPKIIRYAKKHTRKIIKTKDDANGNFRTPDEMLKIANAMKEYIENTWGDNYRIISLGTSPAALCETLSHLGCNVLFMPISGLGGRRKHIYEDKKNTVLRASLIYLKKQGLSNDGKKNIIIDYTSSGNTLKMANSVIKQYCSEIPEANFELIPLCYGKLSEIFEASSQNLTRNDARRFELDMIYERAEHFCCVPHAYAWMSLGDKSLKTFFKEFDDYSSDTARAYQLCILDKIYNNGKKNPNLHSD